MVKRPGEDASTSSSEEPQFKVPKLPGQPPEAAPQEEPGMFPVRLFLSTYLEVDATNGELKNHAVSRESAPLRIYLPPFYPLCLSV